MPITMSLGELRQLEALAEKAKTNAAKAIKKESDAWRFFDALDQVPDGWDFGKHGDCDDFCRPCLDRIAKRPAVKKLLDAVGWDGPHRYGDDEGESSRNCYACGRPLPWALLKYGMEYELSHYEWDGIHRTQASPNEWYWLWRLADECLTCETYLNDYGQRVRNVLRKAFGITLN